MREPLPFTQAEIDYIAANYPTIGPWKCAQALGRQYRQVYFKARELGVRRDYSLTGKKCPCCGGRMYFYNGRWTIATDKGARNYSRHLIEESLGRTLLRREHVHHINGDRSDDRLENLMVLDHAEHLRLHRKQKLANAEGKITA